MAYLIPPSVLIPFYPWGLKLRMPIPISGAGQGMFADGRPILFGGRNVALTQTGVQAEQSITDTYVIAADASSVTTAGALPTAIFDGRSTLLGDGRVLAISTEQGINIVQTIDPGSLLWTAQAQMLHPFGDPALVTLPSGNALRIGGTDALSNPSPSVEEYDRLTDTWSSKADMLNPHVSPSATTLANGDVFVSSFGAAPEVYRHSNDTWYPTTNSPRPGNLCQTQVNLPGGKLFTCTSTNGFVLTPDIFDPVGRIFTPAALYQATHSEHSSNAHFPTGFYLGEGLVLIINAGAPRTAIYDYRLKKWYGGGFDFDTHPLDFNETLGASNIFYLGQYGFLTTGGGVTTVVPHRPSYYVQLSTLPRTPDHIPTFAGVVSITQGTADGSVFVEWAPASDAVTAVDDFNYYVYVAPDPASVDFTPGTESSNTEIWAGSLSREITGLSLGSLYHFGVRARNVRGLNESGNYDTNVVTASFTTGSPGIPTFAWTPTVPMHEPRAGLFGATRADGRYHVFGGFTVVGVTISSGGDIYAQNGLTRFPSDLGPELALGASLNESPQNSFQHHRPTAVGGTSDNTVATTSVVKNYPYTDDWFNHDGNVDTGSNPQPLNQAVANHTAVALPFGDILRIGGTTSLNIASTAVNTVERMFYRPRKVDYRAQTTPFSVGDTLTGNGGAQSKIVADSGMIYTFMRISSNVDFVVGENVTGQSSGSTGQVLAVGVYQGNENALYLSTGGGTFTEGEQILGDVAGNAFIQLTNFFQAAIVTPVGTLTLESLTDTTFSNGEGITGGLGGDGTVVNHPQGFGFILFDNSHGFQSWEFVTPLNRARYTHSSILLDDGRVFIIGGQNASGLPELTAEIFDVTANTCSLVTNVTPSILALPYDINTVIGNFSGGENITGQISGATAVVVSDDFSGTVTVNTVVGTFDPTEQIIGDVAGNATLVGPLLHLIQPHFQCPIVRLLTGDILTIGGGSFYVSKFTPGADALTLVASLATVKTEHTAIVFGDGKVGVFGGRVGGVAVADVRLYDPNLDSWSSPADMITARCGHVSFLLPNNKVLVVGGEDDSGNATDLAELSS